MMPPQPNNNILSRIFMRHPNLTVFTTNFCIMTLELVAGRLIAPHVGVSLYTWTAVIGIVLLGITVGNYYGGKFADSWASPRLVGVALAGASLFSFFSLVVSLFGGPALAGLPLPYVAVVLLTTLIFFFPSVMLGMVSPVIVKLTLHNLDTTGDTVGKIYAAAALGSIIGTYLTGFWLISTLGVVAIILLVAVVLFVMALGYLDLESLSYRHKVVSLILAFFVLLAGSGILWQFRLCTYESDYYCINVSGADDDVKFMHLNRLLHSITDMQDPLRLDYAYEAFFAGLYEYQQDRDGRLPRALFLGGGAYTLPRYLVARYDDPRGVVAEIDPLVSQLAFDEFDMPRDSMLETATVDGRMYVKGLQAEEQFDIIFGDAFSDFSIPYHLTTVEFNQMLAEHLAPSGLYAANVIDSFEPGLFLASYLRTLEAVFEHVALFLPEEDTALDDTRTTFVVVASGKPINHARLEAAFSRLGARASLATRVSNDAVAQLLATADSPRLLTDNFAPVDNLIAPVFANSGR